MPGNKTKKQQPQQVESIVRTRQQTIADNVTGQISGQIDGRFKSIESSIAAIAAQVTQVAKATAKNAENYAKDAKKQKEKERAEARVAKKQPSVPDNEHLIQGNNDIEELLGIEKVLDNAEGGQGREQTLNQTSASAQPLSTNNNPWPVSVFQQTDPSLALFQGPLPSAASELAANKVLDDKVNHILMSTPHQLEKGGKKQPLFAHNYVYRGAELKQATLNSLSLAEYGWAITRMFKDKAVPNDIKPHLLTHLEEILEDAVTYDWERGVRRWSEQVFGLIAQNRLEEGWKSYARIQMLRLSFSKVGNARQPQGSQKENTNRDTFARDREPYARPRPYTPAQNPEFLKGGPPCSAFNSQQGCQFNSGHSVNGKRMVHICTFCLYNTSAANPHSVVECRNKLRANSSYNQ